MSMKLIVGLGNPGTDYKSTKHNAGFWVVDSVAENLGISFNKRKFNAQFGQGKYKSKGFIIIKPLTYMNRSGDAVVNFVNYFKIDNSDILVIFDDVSLPLGTIRLRQTGSAGGHNGLRSIINVLGSTNLDRLRFGIKTDSHPERDLSKYVLSGFAEEDDREIAKDTIVRSKEAVLVWMDKGIDFAMNSFNEKGGRT